MEFHQLTRADIPAVRALLHGMPMGTCDFTVGGIFLWADYFNYTGCIIDDTLFIKGLIEDDMTRTAFSIPVGRMPLDQSIALLRDYAETHDMPLILSAVPEHAIATLQTLGATHVHELADWADYIYDIEPMSTFAGKKMSKKRNHLNRFKADWPDARFEPLTPDNIGAVIDFYERHPLDPDKPAIAEFDRKQTFDVLHHLDDYGFEGAMLSTPKHGVVAFTLGEAVSDTLHVHIEKMDHEVTGSGETICRDFCAMMRERHPELRFVNREDDSGDPGLRQAKLAYNPIYQLRKFNVTF